jgi:hypothetical protein
VDVFNTPVFEIYSTNSGGCCNCITIQYSTNDPGSIASTGTYLNCNNLEQNWTIVEAVGESTIIGVASICTSSPQTITFPSINEAGNPFIHISNCFSIEIDDYLQGICESDENKICFSMFYSFGEADFEESIFPCGIENKLILAGQLVNGKYSYKFEYDCGPAMSSTCSPLGLNTYKIEWSITNNRWELFLENNPSNILAYLNNTSSQPFGELRTSWVWNDLTAEFPVIVITRPNSCPKKLCLTVFTEAIDVQYIQLISIYDTLDNTPGPSFTKPYYVALCDESGISTYKIRWNSILNIYELFLYDSFSSTFIKYAETTISNLETNYNLSWDTLPAYQGAIEFQTIASIICPSV